MNYNNERYCRLKDGTIEPLFYGSTNEPRTFYFEKGKWFLEHDKFYENKIAYCVSEIVEFIKAKDIENELEDKPTSPLKGKTRSEISKIAAARKCCNIIQAFFYTVDRNEKTTYKKGEVKRLLVDIQKFINRQFLTKKQGMKRRCAK